MNAEKAARRVLRARRRLQEADRGYRVALVEATAGALTGLSFAELARLLGTSRQAARQLVDRARVELERERAGASAG